MANKGISILYLLLKIVIAVRYHCPKYDALAQLEILLVVMGKEKLISFFKIDSSQSTIITTFNY